MASATLTAFQRAITRWEREKIHPAIALRNTVGVVLPLITAALLGQASVGLVMALGALNVAYSDGLDAFAIRGRRMLLSCFFCSLAVLAGGISGSNHAAAVVAVMTWGFGAGLVVALGTTAADLGTISLVTLVVFAARPLSWRQALIASAAAFGGGILQTALALLLSPIGRHQQDREVLAGVFGKLSQLARASTAPGTAPLATAEFTLAREVIRSRNRDHTPQMELFTALLSQAERMRLRLLTLARLHRRLARDPLAESVTRHVDSFRDAAATAMDRLRTALEGRDSPSGNETVGAVETAVEQMRREATGSLSAFSHAVARDAVLLMDSIAGQLRAALRMSQERSLSESPTQDSFRPPSSDLFARSRLQALRANLSLQSVAFRHALRLAVCVAIGEALSTVVDWQRSYWIPMTIAIVLKPDFLSTFSRGALRLAGTFLGLLVATAIYRVAPASVTTDITVVGLFTLILRWWGPANYAILTLAVSAIVVALLAGTGVAPSTVILLRGMNTAIGGVLAMLAYALWPTWERTHAGESMARLIDAYRTYLRAIGAIYLHPDSQNHSELDRARQSARVARTNAEASVDRLGTEPGGNGKIVQLAASMLASSHNFIYASMTLEAGPVQEPAAIEPCLPALREFLDHVDLMLYFIATALRGSAAELHQVSTLRERYRALTECLTSNGFADSLIQVEADRMSNALDTLRDHVLDWTNARKRTKAA